MERTKDLIPKQLLIENFKIKPWLATIVMQVMKINKLNRFHRTELIPYSSYVEMFGKALEKLNIKVNFDRSFLDKLQSKAFFTVSNHAFGFADALILVSHIGITRPTIKITANYLLSKMEAGKAYVIPVNPFDGKGKKKTMGGTKNALDWIQQGNPICLFPAGEVATYYKGSKEITDRPWPTSTFRLIRMAQVPIVPIYFEGTNSRMFHFLGRITPYWRTFRLIKELFKKRNSTINIRTGDVVYPETYNQYETDEELGNFFRNEVFKLKKIR